MKLLDFLISYPNCVVCGEPLAREEHNDGNEYYDGPASTGKLYSICECLKCKCMEIYTNNYDTSGDARVDEICIYLDSANKNYFMMSLVPGSGRRQGATFSTPKINNEIDNVIIRKDKFIAQFAIDDFNKWMDPKYALDRINKLIALK